MNTTPPDVIPQPYWFVGAAFGGEDQTPRFLEEGIWENGHEDKYLDLVRSMDSGDRIAIKAIYSRKNGLPFENLGEDVSVMSIKATGTITENPGDGQLVYVDWDNERATQREWYLSTYWQTVHAIFSGENWWKDELIEFTFGRKSQDIRRFLREPRWRGRYGGDSGDERFRWTNFYTAIAEKLLDYQNDRGSLVDGIHQIAAQMELGYLTDIFPGGTMGPLTDICPFTVMGMFNRSMTLDNRRAIAGKLASFLGVEVPVPNSMTGVPTLNNMRSWFFSYSIKRGDGDIDALWRVFSSAHHFVGSDLPEVHAELVEAYDGALKVKGVGWNLSIGLYWAHPWDFPALDGYSREYVSDQLELPISQTTPCNAESYLTLLNDLKVSFDDEGCQINSFPELAYKAWFGDTGEEPLDTVGTYSVEDVLREGCFLEREEIERLLGRLQAKKNLILQGPPGTGKTWLARRLAFALIGRRDNNDDRKVRVVQFHPNLSYEDFVRGWRPMGDGTLSLVDGVFMEAIRSASEEPSASFVVVIEEINRGNPAQIFGELLTLLEADKRTPDDAIELCYPDQDGSREPIHVPENLHIIGTMNIADRSLALVDLAFRRRFAFVTLKPRLGETWCEWVVQERGVEPDRVEDIGHRITELNDRIAKDSKLGPQFQIGHSYVTPKNPLEPGTTNEWFKQVVETEIGPLLEEYWFDSPQDAAEATKKLLDRW